MTPYRTSEITVGKNMKERKKKTDCNNERLMERERERQRRGKERVRNRINVEYKVEENGTVRFVYIGTDLAKINPRTC